MGHIMRKRYIPKGLFRPVKTLFVSLFTPVVPFPTSQLLEYGGELILQRLFSTRFFHNDDVTRMVA
jgi:hypothetical protein